MHPFFVFGALLHATALAVVAFFVLFAAARAEGLVKTLGNVLGVWTLFVAVIALVGAAASPMLVGRGYGAGMMQGMGPRWMHQWCQQPEAAPTEATPAPAPSPAPPANP